MPRKITSGRVGGQLLGSLSTADNTVESVEANANIVLKPDGTGIVQSDKDLKIADNKQLVLSSNNNFNASIKAPTGLAASYSLVLPPNDGDADQFLKTDGSGTLTFAAPALAVSNQTADTINDYYPLMGTVTTGSVSELSTSSSKLSFRTDTGILTATGFSGPISGNVTSSSVNISGGSINGTTIGSSSASTGAFTTLTATTITETSSIAYKENVNPIINGLDNILNLSGVTYDRKDGSASNEAGLIAEEVAKVIPNIVSYKKGSPEGINYTKLTAYLIEAVKELKSEIDKLKG